jgi:hypothetical protein
MLWTRAVDVASVRKKAERDVCVKIKREEE